MSDFWKTLNAPFLVLAPMEDVTDFVFREIISEIAKPDVLYTEFTNTDALMSNGYSNTIQNLKYSEKQRPIVAQIWGTKPENFYKSAKLINNLKFDGIDINMGCPDKKVIKVGSGSALIGNYSLAKQIIKATKDGAKNIPVSVKTRLGITGIITEDWISFLLNQKLNALAIHARTSKQMSRGNADWDEIGKSVRLKNKLSPDTVIIGNGDVLSYGEALIKYKKYQVNGIMIGRGVLKNPWVFEKTGQHSSQESINLLLKHAILYNKEWGNIKNFENMKKFFKMYVYSFAGANDFRKKLMMCKDIDNVKECINSYVAKLK